MAMLKNVVDVNKTKECICTSKPQKREQRDQQVCLPHTCWFVRNVRPAQMYVKNAVDVNKFDSVLVRFPSCKSAMCHKPMLSLA